MAETSFILVADSLGQLPAMLKAAFRHPWVSTSTIGFGPPLVGSSPRLVSRLKTVTGGVLEKLEIYLEHCVLDDAERQRLAAILRRDVVRSEGPVEAEALDRASCRALELSLRLYAPKAAPPRVKQEMEALGLDSFVPDDVSSEDLEGRFLVRLEDPRSERILYHEKVRALSSAESPLALELRVQMSCRILWRRFCENLAESIRIRCVPLEDPLAHARVSRNGSRT